ncbi:MAG: aldo/keto reductase [Kiritimatiellae bacterium]|nr:aldo/keto reductase [Kiritimatiellia bacterium]
MNYRTLTGTDLTVSRICLGTWIFGSRVDEKESIRMIHAALDAGVIFFDTADSYSDGASERILGKALEGRRKDSIVASKVGYLPGDEADLSASHIEEAVESSLKRLNVESLDICYFHAPDYTTPLDESLKAMDGLVRAGKVRHAGLSNYAAWQMCRAHWLCERGGYRRPAVAQTVYNLLARRIEQEFLPCCGELGIGVTVFNPLAGGLLTGKHRPEHAPREGSRFDWSPKYRTRYWHEANFEAVATLSEIARKCGKTPVGLALQWLAAQPQIDSIVIGASRPGQLEENLHSCEGTLDDDTREACNAVWARVRGTACEYGR